MQSISLRADVSGGLRFDNKRYEHLNSEISHIIKPCAASLLVDDAQSGCDQSLRNSSNSRSSLKQRKHLSLKLLISADPKEETAVENEDHVEWSLENPEDSSPCALSSIDSGSRSASLDDSGFSSDETTVQLPKESCCKLNRTKSLRSALRSPTRTASQKRVRFADSLGLHLEHKAYFNDDEWRHNEFNSPLPLLPPSKVFPATQKKKNRNVRLVLTNFTSRSEAETSHLTRTHCVCLSSVNTIDTNVTGYINVLNLAFEKQVFVRYSTDSWMSYSETSAVYSRPLGTDGAVDEFRFFLSLPNNLPVGATCQFCIHYDVNGTSYWDSNNGFNYVLQSMEVLSDENVIKPELKQSSQKFPPWAKPRSKSPTRQKKQRNTSSGDKFDYLPHLPVHPRLTKTSGWGHCGYSFDDEMGFY